MKVSPSILSADFSNLLEDIKKIENGKADYIHIDVMDGHFVPNISFGAPIMKSLTGKTNIPYDVHLMIDNPEKYIKDFVTPQTEFITVHLEVMDKNPNALDLIKEKGIKAGLSINPETDIDDIFKYLGKCDLVLVMSVHPGFGGQKFIPETLEKVKILNEYRKMNNLNYVIEIDGGINLNNASVVKESGCDILVAGSAIFNALDVTEATINFKNI